ncbi:hypothetical protein DEJ31_09665 [Curtobacterium sp. MCPF17_031]|nr:hypothetical protein DEJ31_09665 [Curtobacterium sp. MCPF17_031]
MNRDMSRDATEPGLSTGPRADHLWTEPARRPLWRDRPRRDRPRRDRPRRDRPRRDRPRTDQVRRTRPRRD